MDSSELALVKANAEIKALQESVACLDRKLTQLLSVPSPPRAQLHSAQTAFDVLTGPSMPRSRSTATLDRLNAQSTVESEEVAMGTTRVVMHQIVLPSDSDTLGICFGGQVLGWIDICAGLAAKTAARGPCVTASVDAVHFLKPCRVVCRLLCQLSILIQRISAIACAGISSNHRCHGQSDFSVFVGGEYLLRHPHCLQAILSSSLPSSGALLQPPLLCTCWQSCTVV